MAAGMADRAHPADELDAAVLDGAKRVAKVLLELIVLGKRAAHRAMEAQGVRTGIRATAEIRTLGFHEAHSIAYLQSFAKVGVSKALSERDAACNDYRKAPEPGSDG